MKHPLRLAPLVIAGAVAVFGLCVVCDEASRIRQKETLRRFGETCVTYEDSWTGPRIAKHWKPHSYDYFFDHLHHRGVSCAPEDYPAGVQEDEVGYIGRVELAVTKQ